MSHQHLSPLAQSSRAALHEKLREHDDALNALEAGGPGGADLDLFTMTNGDAVPLVPGMPVVSNTAAVLLRADASSEALSPVMGLVTVGADLTLSATVQTAGAVVLTTEQWDAVTGQVGGLQPGQRYYLDTSPGRITTTPPSAPGTSIAPIGRAASSTVLVIRIAMYVLQ